MSKRACVGLGVLIGQSLMIVVPRLVIAIVTGQRPKRWLIQ